MKIIGLGHYSRTGKDTVANALVKELADTGVRAKKISFAWKLKDMCHQLYGWAGVREPEYYETLEGEKDRAVRLPKLASEKYPQGPTVVELWIDFGTPAIRDKVFQGSWIQYVLQTDHECDVLLIPDVRFANEITAIREENGTLLKCVRPGFKPRNSVADMNLWLYKGWDGIIGTSGQMSELQYEAKRVAEDILAGRPITFNARKTAKGYQMEAESGVPQEWVEKYSHKFT